jgi:site-specific DNA-cytosine methylase
MPNDHTSTISAGATGFSYNVLDLFSGIGGFSLGLERAGMRTTAFCEIEPFCRKVLARHWPGVPIHDDIRTLDATQYVGSVDVVCGGYPCQPFSAAGKQQGEEDPRHLWPEMHRIIRQARPRWVIAENVRGHVSLGFDAVATQLEDDGFTVWPFIVPASAVGAPHRRDRLWILAHNQSIGGREAGGLRGGTAEVGGAENLPVEHGCEALANSQRTGLEGHSRNGPHTPGRKEPNGPAREGGLRRNVADTQGDGRRQMLTVGTAAIQRPDGSQEPEERRGRFTSPEWRTTNWAIEPDVGGRLDGFSCWLDRLDMTIPHALLMADGVTEARAREELQALPHSAKAEEVWQAARGHGGVSPQGVLFAYLRQLQTRTTDEARLQLPRTEAPQGTMRGLWDDVLPARPSHQPDQVGQFAEQHPDAVQALPRLLAQHAEKAWLAYCREHAVPRGWEEGISRVAHGVSSRVDRLKSLGNAVVPQIPELIGRSIIGFEQQLELAA